MLSRRIVMLLSGRVVVVMCSGCHVESSYVVVVVLLSCRVVIITLLSCIE